MFHDALATVRQTAAAHASALDALEHAVTAATVLPLASSVLKKGRKEVVGSLDHLKLLTDNA